MYLGIEIPKDNRNFKEDIEDYIPTDKYILTRSLC